MHAKQVVIGLGVVGAGYWLWNRFGDNVTGAYDALTHPSTPGTTPVQTNSTTTNTATPVQTNSQPGYTAPLPTQPPPTAPPVTNQQAWQQSVDAANVALAAQQPFTDYINGLHLVDAGAVPLFSADEWNWYYGNWSHTPQTADLFPEGDRGALMTVGIYQSRRQAAGLSGLRFPAAGNYLRRGNG